jgi:hypothetical protein
MSLAKKYGVSLEVEVLETRDLLSSTLLWIGPANGGNINNANNWINEATGIIAAPVSGDNLDFNPNLSVKDPNNVWHQGSNSSAGDDEPAAFNYGNILLSPFYSLTVTLQGRIFAGTLTLGGGELAQTGTSNAVIAGPAANLIVQGGTLAGFWQIGNGTTSGTMGISLNPQVQHPERIVINWLDVNNGQVTWSSGDMSMGILDVDSAGTFTIRTDSTMSSAGPGSGIGVEGIFQKASGVGTTTIALGLGNSASGDLIASSGTLTFQSGITQVGNNALITLNGGNLTDTDPDYGIILEGGALTGVGTVTANVDNGNRFGGGWVRPGLSGSGGTLNIVGNFEQNQYGGLWIDATAAGSVGLLNVSGQGAGNITLAGTLNVNRNVSYTPSRGSSFTFLTWSGARTGDFGTTTYVNNSWVDNQNNNDRFSAQRNDAQKQYNLVVVAA